MKTILLALVLTLTTAVSASNRSTASAAADSSLSSYQQARAVLERSIEVAGGESNIRRLRNVSLTYTGFRNMINQSRRPLPPWDREPASGKIIVDRDGERMFAENYTSYPGIGRFGGAWALKGDRGVHWEPARNHHGSEIIMNVSGNDANGPWAFIPRWIPPLLLLAARDSDTNLRSLGTTTRDGKAMHSLAWTQRDGATVTLLVDAASGAFSGFESIRSDGVYGDVTERIEYSRPRAIDGVIFPARRVDWFNGEIARELDLDYRVNATLEDSQFELPPGYEQPQATPESERLKKVTDGVFLDTQMGGVMIVEFKDFLVVVECPDGYDMANSTIEALRAAFPDKPVRYVVPSHTHGDHGGGARAYFHAGATLITTPGNVEFYRQLAQLRGTISPDPYVATGKGPAIETFRGKRTLSDGKRSMVLYDIGPNAHAEELTMVHLPKQADVYFTPATGDSINPAMPIGIDFARKLKSLGIDNFEALLEAHNSRVVSISEFRRALALSGYRDY